MFFLVGSILGTKTSVDTSHPMILFAIGIVFASELQSCAEESSQMDLMMQAVRKRLDNAGLSEK